MQHVIKNYENKYLMSCAELVKETWDFHSSYQDLTDVMPIYIAYVRECIDFSLHLEIIVDENDKVCGLLFGSIENPSFVKKIKCFSNHLQTRLWIRKNWISGKFGNKSVAFQNLKSHAKIEQDGEKCSDLFDGEVNLFIVSKELRGKRFGYRLMNNYVEFCRKNHLKTIFLWTELGCSYTFYERYGFKKYSTFHNENLTDGNKTQDNGFVYYYDINNPEESETKITLRPVDDTNKNAVVALEVSESQKHMIEPITECLNDAQIHAYDIEWETSAILLNSKVIGFSMYGVWHDSKGKDEDEVWLDRFMIDQKYQGKGYGKLALRELIAMLTAKYHCDDIYLSVYENNQSAIALYKKTGFRFNGEKDENGEHVMVLEM
ncbi:ribosomal protein S18 acetylase RimI-like enzyme [Methanofollis sp. W23]|uniref:GNAT family N-acetyltransferase n=1 Tax=Methanofollis sp. W23 TaxID=2817849 RepID=UPI001AE533CE|nr:GNAT family N-acetyltransferase [Methanofollis sp. W23]MBP2145115.1 ribosomal protein S18 acetylase RimI-like enzyme [Methanofollis sp. W23]